MVYWQDGATKILPAAVFCWCLCLLLTFGGIIKKKEKDIEYLLLSIDNINDILNNKGISIEGLQRVLVDFDLEKKLIHVRRTLVYQKYDNDTRKTFHFELPKTKTSYRDIPINKQCEIALKKQYMQKNIIADKAPKSKIPEKQFQDLLFTTKFNTPLNSQIVCDAIKKIVNEINLMRDVTEEMELFSCHCFRHTFATRCFEAGIKPKTVQGYLGHASLQMTMDLYTSLLKDYQKSEMDKLDNILEKISLSGDDFIEMKYNKELNKSHNNIVSYGDYVVV